MSRLNRGLKKADEIDLLCLRQNVVLESVELGLKGLEGSYRAEDRKQLGTCLLQELLGGMGQPPEYKILLTEAKGFDAYARVHSGRSEVSLLLGIRRATQGSEIALIIDPTKRSLLCAALPSQKELIEHVRSIVEGNFSRLFHGKAKWMSRAQFEESFMHSTCQG